MPKIEPLADAPCRITRGEGGLGATSLRFHGVVFASFRQAETAELRVGKDGKAATMSITTKELTLVGDVDPKTAALSPREDPLFGGFLRVEEGSFSGLREGQPTSATVSVRLPRFVEPAKSLDVTLPCEKLALGPRPWRERAKGKYVMFVDGVDAPLRARPGGEIVAQIRIAKAPKLPPPSPARAGKVAGRFPPGAIVALAGLSTDTFMLTILELEREKAEARIQIFSDTTTIEGWVPSAILVERPSLGGGGFGIGRGHGRAQTMRCTKPVPIYLSQGSDIVLAGAYQPNATIVLAPPTANARLDRRTVLLPREVGGGLGFGAGRAAGAQEGAAQGEAPPPIVAFVTTDTVEGCTEPPPATAP